MHYEIIWRLRWLTFLFLVFSEFVFISDSDIQSSACSLLFAPSSSSITIVVIVSKSSAYIVSSIVFNKFFFPFLLAFFFSTLSLNHSFSEVKYKGFLRLLFDLTGVLSTSSIIIDITDMSSTTPLWCILPMYLSHMNLAFIMNQIICVAIGIQWPNYFHMFFILLLFLLYLLISLTP